MHACSKHGLRITVEVILGDPPRAPIAYIPHASLQMVEEDFRWQVVIGTIPMITAGARLGAGFGNLRRFTFAI